MTVDVYLHSVSHHHPICGIIYTRTKCAVIHSWKWFNKYNVYSCLTFLETHGWFYSSHRHQCVYEPREPIPSSIKRKKKIPRIIFLSVLIMLPVIPLSLPLSLYKLCSVGGVANHSQMVQSCSNRTKSCNFTVTDSKNIFFLFGDKTGERRVMIQSVPWFLFGGFHSNRETMRRVTGSTGGGYVTSNHRKCRNNWNRANHVAHIRPAE